MKKISCITLTIALSLTTGMANAFSLGDAAKLTTGAAAPQSSAAKSAELVSKLSELNVSPEQAMGGAGALLELAKNRLTGADYSQLLESAPALKNLSGNGALGQLGAASGLLGKSNPLKSAKTSEVQSLDDVTQAFSGLGMNTSMVGQFTPVLLQFLGDQGTSASLLQNLSGIWGAPAAL